MNQTYYSDFEDGGNEKQFHFVEVLPSGSTDEPIHVTNENLLQESVKLTESLCSEDNLRFGACESSELTMTVANVFENFEGRTFHAYVHMLDDNSNDVIVNYGYFTVKSDKPQANRVWRKITAYDAMNTILNADVLTWFRGLTFPMTLAAFRNSFFTHLGITQKVQSLINDSFSIPGGFTASEYLSGKTIITAICELNGVFGHINRDGNFEYVSFGGNAGFVCPPFENNSVTYEDYTTDLITKITMRGSASDVGTSVGVDGNEYIITGNPLIYGTEGESALITALNNLLAKVGTISFRPYTVGKTIGNPCVELGDAITVNTTYETITSAVVSRVLSGIQALRDKYTASGDKTYPTDVNSYSSEVSRTQGKMNELTRTVDETVSTVATYSTAIATANQNASTALSTVQQMANKIVLKVDSNGNIVKVALESDPSTGSTFKVSADNISFFSNGVMELSANNLQINSTNFKVDSAGNLTCANATITGGKLDVQSTANGITNRMLVENGRLSQTQTDPYNTRYDVEIFYGSVSAYRNGYKTFDIYQNGHNGSSILMQDINAQSGLRLFSGEPTYSLKALEVFNTTKTPYSEGIVAWILNDGSASFSEALSISTYPIIDPTGSVLIYYGWTFLAPDNSNPNRLALRWSAPDGSAGYLYDTELKCLEGVTSSIQTQLDAKQASITGGATTIVSSNLTASRALISNSNGKVAVSSVTSTELGYLSGVTSAIQTQLDAKLSGTVAIANGGTGATTRLDAVKALTNQNVGTGATYFLTITNSWGKAGYTSVADAKTVLGLGSAAYETVDTAATASTVVKRTANKYIYASYFNTSAGNENPASFTSYPAFIDSSGWLRKTSKANMTSWLGMVPFYNAGGTTTQTAVTPVNTNTSTNITIKDDCWMVAAFHVVANTNGICVLAIGSSYVIYNLGSSGACNYWANATVPIKKGDAVSYRLSSNATDSKIHFYKMR